MDEKKKAGNPTWRKGQTGNPKGRPPKGRALSEILAAVGDAEIRILGADGEETEVARKYLMAQKVWQFVNTGEVTLPEGRRIRARHFEEWFHAVKFIYQHIDGPPPKQVEIVGTGKDGALEIDHTLNAESMNESLTALGATLREMGAEDDESDPDS